MKSLYRCFDASGNLLYIGVTKNLSRRMQQHKSKSPWFHMVASTSFDQPISAKEAHAQERRAIIDERPICNLRGNPTTNESFLEAARLSSILSADVKIDSGCTFGQDILSFVRRIEALRASPCNQKKAEIAVLNEASAAGYMKRIIRSIVKQRAMLLEGHTVETLRAAVIAENPQRSPISNNSRV